jgi:transcriptional regulator GlxA family with amidase domain
MAEGKRKHLRLVHDSARKPRRDERVHEAIELMGRELAKRWTVSELARRVGLSRPAFARRFKESTGESPLRHLVRKRMERAAELVRTTDWGLAQIAGRVGYDSEFAFNRAFKRAHRLAPGTFRKLGYAPTMRAA